LIKCKTLEDVINTYGSENIVKIVNLKQILTYARMKCQPVWIDEGYNERLVCYYFKPETELAWQYWKTTKRE
jgi:hypothetical protein